MKINRERTHLLGCKLRGLKAQVNDPGRRGPSARTGKPGRRHRMRTILIAFLDAGVGFEPTTFRL